MLSYQFFIAGKICAISASLMRIYCLHLRELLTDVGYAVFKRAVHLISVHKIATMLYSFLIRNLYNKMRNNWVDILFFIVHQYVIFKETISIFQQRYTHTIASTLLSIYGSSPIIRNDKRILNCFFFLLHHK